MRLVGLGGNTWPDPCAPYRFLCSNSQIPGILGQLDLAVGLSLRCHSLSGCSYGHCLIVSKKSINWMLEVETLVKVQGAQQGCPARCRPWWLHCQSQKWSNTRTESTCKYERLKRLSWVG